MDLYPALNMLKWMPTTRTRWVRQKSEYGRKVMVNWKFSPFACSKALALSLLQFTVNMVANLCQPSAS